MDIEDSARTVLSISSPQITLMAERAERQLAIEIAVSAGDQFPGILEDRGIDTLTDQACDALRSARDYGVSERNILLRFALMLVLVGPDNTKNPSVSRSFEMGGMSANDIARTMASTFESKLQDAGIR